MNFFKRAIKYSARQKLRSLLLFLTFTLLSTTILIALSSEKAVQQGTKQIKETVGASVRMEIDMNNQNNFGPAEDFGNGASGYTYNGDRITEKIINSIAELPNVVSYNAKIEDAYWGLPENFEPIPGMVNAPGLSIPYTAILDSSLDVKFLNGSYKLEEGRHIKPNDSCTALISKELADRNNLSVGDKITFQEFETGKTECTFTIVGIYSGTEGTTKQAITPDGIPANCGYIDMEGLKKFYSRGNEKLEGYDNLDIYTHSPEEAKELMETIKDLPEVKGKTFTFDVNTEDFDMVSTPLSSFGSMVDTAVLTITVIGMLIIVLFLVLWTRSRNKEIAILLAVGRSKVEIIAQFLVENILIGILSIFASTALSFGLANQIGSFIISKAGENISNLNIQIATSDMIKVFGIGFILICLAVIIASYTIIRLRPKDILTKME
ncbi:MULTISPECIES: ABC transporter permease [Lachnospiraceae]|jgi:putative ABC transport system permease protein|uniref:ABC transporter permease n=1 Tax=Clostridia TaxID=186801 RepID=UPI0006C8255B|nr:MULTISPECIES: FtsX-like permease family protein [Lachnospiraceae]MDB3325326.1 ABC transporter permease [Clostridioides difficile]RHT59908.1 ABC transporter permease [Ruminococcus sp. AM28-41]RHV85251.1 ABC transporter permease [Lachnospiraceae bacterium OF09-33XD]RGW19989.1 ABC transporter permease [Mediterraneibacter gnavus]RGZ30486.1 ABC transporter permease [Mediterraneibacter gnavus]